MDSLEKQENDDDSFIILSSSPHSSLGSHYNGDTMIDEDEIANAMKDVSPEVSMAIRAHFKKGGTPSPASIMIASNMVSEEKSIEELQQQFGQLLDENLILKDSLKQNTDSMREQFMMLMSCQEDMIKTHKLHKDKFEQTKALVEKLRQENRRLKQDLVRLTDSSAQTSREHTSPLEFVSSPEDDTINKLTAQLELVEKQRREVIHNNEKMVWQKESLEHMIDSTTKERDELKEKLRQVELDLAAKDLDATSKLNHLNFRNQMLQGQIMQLSKAESALEELKKRDNTIKEMKDKILSLQSELKSARLDILDLENVKLEFSQYKTGTNETIRIYKDQIQDLQNRIREVQTTVFQPVRTSLDPTLSRTESNGLVQNVKMYDQTMKHVSDMLNALTNNTIDNIAQSMTVITSLNEFKLDKTNATHVMNALLDMKKNLEKQHSAATYNSSQIRSTMSIFEGIFKDYNELLKKDLVVQEKYENRAPSGENVQALTAALVARGQELQNLETEVQKLKAEKEDCELLKAQLDIYKNDFDAEREARQKMASEKETILTDLRTEKRKTEELTKQLEELRKPASRGLGAVPRKASVASSLKPAPSNVQTFRCPKCNKFSSSDYKLMEDHFDFCLDDF